MSSNLQKSSRAILIEQPQTFPKIASVALPVGIWLMFDGAGAVKPLLPGAQVVGLNLSPIASTDTDFASNKPITYDSIADRIDRWLMPVTNGTLTTAMVGLLFNVFTDNYGLNVASYSTLTYNTLAVSTFAVGHTITGTTSGATGVITGVITLPNGSQQLTYTVTAGVFVSGETITDGTSSATAKVGVIFTGGTQFRVTKFISTTLAEVEVVLLA